LKVETITGMQLLNLYLSILVMKHVLPITMLHDVLQTSK